MNKELFGVFGDAAAFAEQTGDRHFTAMAVGPELAVGVRDPDLGEPGRSAVVETDDGVCAVWGEAFTPDDATLEAGTATSGDDGPTTDAGTAGWLLDAVATEGRAALDGLNGSYIAVVDTGETTLVATDRARTRECFYTEAPEVIAFGSDAGAVAGTIPYPRLRQQGVFEFLHLGVVLGDGTLLESLRRVPFDGVLEPGATGSLSRFVYAPTAFDHVGELARRLQRAFDRRRYAGRHAGLLLSAGFDSRTFLSFHGGVDQCYTVGEGGSPETRQAARLASRYGAVHTVFPPDERYLDPQTHKVAHSHGTRESLHAHHAGFEEHIHADVLFHGLLFDTFLRDYFVPRAELEAFGWTLPLDRTEPDPDPVDALLEPLPYAPAGSETFVAETGLGPADPESFVREALAGELARYADRADAVENRISVTGIANQPSLSFHDHLADHHTASFVSADRELLEWHLAAPPAARTRSTFLDACRALDPDLLAVRPPNRRFDSSTASALDTFARQLLPLTDSPGNAWPSRDELADRHDLQETLFPRRPNLQALGSRHALRVNDVHGWVDSVVDTEVDLDDLLAAE